MPKARSSSGLRSRNRAGLPSRSSTSARLTRSSCSLASLSLPLAFLVEVVDALFQAVEIGEHQLGLDGLDIGQRRDLAFDMGDVGILKAAHHMRDRVDLADGGEKLVAEALALRGAAHQAGDIDEGQPRRDDLRRFGDLGELVEPRIRHRDLADIRLDGAERIIRRLRRRRLGQRIEQRRLADIGQSDDTAFESHDRVLKSVRRDRAVASLQRRHRPCRKIPWPASPDAPCSGTSSRGPSRAGRRCRQSLRRAPRPRGDRSWRNRTARGRAPVP